MSFFHILFELGSGKLVNGKRNKSETVENFRLFTIRGKDKT